MNLVPIPISTISHIVYHIPMGNRKWSNSSIRSYINKVDREVAIRCHLKAVTLDEQINPYVHRSDNQFPKTTHLPLKSRISWNDRETRTILSWMPHKRDSMSDGRTITQMAPVTRYLQGCLIVRHTVPSQISRRDRYTLTSWNRNKGCSFVFADGVEGSPWLAADQWGSWLSPERTPRWWSAAWTVPLARDLVVS